MVGRPGCLRAAEAVHSSLSVVPVSPGMGVGGCGDEIVTVAAFEPGERCKALAGVRAALVAMVHGVL